MLHSFLDFLLEFHYRLFQSIWAMVAALSVNARRLNVITRKKRKELDWFVIVDTLMQVIMADMKRTHRLMIQTIQILMTVNDQNGDYGFRYFLNH